MVYKFIILKESKCLCCGEHTTYGKIHVFIFILTNIKVKLNGIEKEKEKKHPKNIKIYKHSIHYTHDRNSIK